MSEASFEDAAGKLLARVRDCVRGGRVSGRALAKLAGLSQPHMHNLLAGKRGMTPGVADRLLDALGLSLRDILGDGGLSAAPALVQFEGALGGGRAFPRIAQGRPAPWFDPARLEGFESPCLGRVADEETSMAPALRPGDDVLVDCGWRARRHPRAEAIYAIEWEGLGYLCRCRLAAGALLTLTDSRCDAGPPPRISLEERQAADVVRGEIVWFGRRVERRAG
jgi:hypothetical protein